MECKESKAEHGEISNDDPYPRRSHFSRYGFTLLRSDTHHFYAFTGTQFVDTLQRWCSTLRGSYSLEAQGPSLQVARPATFPTTKDVFGPPSHASNRSTHTYFATTPTHTFPTP
jgi:hypothetical protein